MIWCVENSIKCVEKSIKLFTYWNFLIFFWHVFSQNDLDEDCDDEDEDDEGDITSKRYVAREYKQLITIHAGKPKGGLEECFKVDPEKVRRLSLSEPQLESAAEAHAKEIIRC